MWKELPPLMEDEKWNLKLENIAYEQFRHLHVNQKFARKINVFETQFYCLKKFYGLET